MENMGSVIGLLIGFFAVFGLFIFIVATVFYVLQGIGLMRVVETNELSSKYTAFGWIPVLSMYLYVLIGTGTPSEGESRRKAKIITVVMLVLPTTIQVLQNIFMQSADGTPIFVGVISTLILLVYLVFSFILFNNYMKAFGVESSKRILYMILAIFTFGLAQVVFIFRHRHDELVYEQKTTDV